MLQCAWGAVNDKQISHVLLTDEAGKDHFLAACLVCPWRVIAHITKRGNAQAMMLLKYGRKLNTIKYLLLLLHFDILK